MTLKTGQQFTTGEMRFGRRPLTDFSSSPFPTPLEAGRNYTSSYVYRASHQQPRIWTETSSEIKNMRALYVYRPGRELESAIQKESGFYNKRRLDSRGGLGCCVCCAGLWRITADKKSPQNTFYKRFRWCVCA